MKRRMRISKASVYLKPLLDFRYWGIGVLCIVLVFVSIGCEEDVNPFIGTEFPFTAWGFVNPKADTHAVRVFTIDERLAIIPSDPLDAVVTVLDVSGNQRFVLQDSVLALPNGDFRHIFWGIFDVDFETTYRLEVERSDGIVTRSADVRTPAPISISVLDPNVNAVSELLLPLELIGDPPSLPRISATYFAYSATNEGQRLQENFVSVDYAGKPVFRNGVWELSIDLRDDFVLIREDFNDKDIVGLICLDEIRLDVHVANEEWRSPIGVFDANFLVEPGTLSNIENGFGFFGAGYVESVAWSPPSVMLVRAGFFDCLG